VAEWAHLLAKTNDTEDEDTKHFAQELRHGDS